MQNIRRFSRLFAIGLSLQLLNACGAQSTMQSAMSDYISRLENVLDITVTPVKMSSPVFPEKSKLKVNVPGVDINLREFYAIKQCELARLVAQRNTALGKAQLPSQRFIYERNLLLAFDNCADEINELNPDLAAKLLGLKAQKQSHYALSWVQLIQQSDETYSALTRKSALIDSENSSQYEQALQDWKLLLRLYSPPDQTNKEKQPETLLEPALKRMANDRLPASVWASQHYLKEQLHGLNSALEQALPAVQCKQGRPSGDAEILRNVFVMFFVEKLQPEGSRVNKLHYDFQSIIDGMLQTPLSEELKLALQTASGEYFAQYQTTFRQHVSLWQGFFKRCNLSPSRG